MSRCFPYPPPGYALSKVQYESWIETIKLQAIKEDKKAEKQWRIEKKEKTRARKERKKTNEELEHSNLSQEPALVLCRPSTSSTKNSHKRKRISAPNENCYDQVISTKLPSQREDEFVASPEEQHPCTPSSHTDSTPAMPTLSPCKPDQVTSTSREELQCTNLFKNWATAQIQHLILSYPEDLDWILKRNNKQVRPTITKGSQQDSILIPQNSTLGPPAKYLDDVSVYARPYVVPL